MYILVPNKVNIYIYLICIVYIDNRSGEKKKKKKKNYNYIKAQLYKVLWNGDEYFISSLTLYLT